MTRPSFADIIYHERRTRRDGLSSNERESVESNFANARLGGISRHPLTGRPTILFITDNGPARYHLNWDDAQNIISGGFDFWFAHTLINCQSPMSSGSPHLAGFHVDGQSVDPLDKSSKACCADKYLPPRNSSSKYGSHLPLIQRIVNIPRRLSNIQYPFIRISIGFGKAMVTVAGRAFKSVQLLQRSISISKGYGAHK